jgi:hypothetical protein
VSRLPPATISWQKTNQPIIFIAPSVLISHLDIIFHHLFNITYPKNLALAGPISKIREQRASPSIKGGGWISLSFLKYRHVMRIGIGAFLGGTITRTPE